MKKLRVMTIVGARPEIIRLSSVFETLKNSAAIEQILVHAGQNYDYELNKVFFKDINMRKSDYSLPNVSEKVRRILLSSTDYVNCVVWQK